MNQTEETAQKEMQKALESFIKDRSSAYPYLQSMKRLSALLEKMEH